MGDGWRPKGHEKNVPALWARARKNILMNKLAQSNEINKYLVELIAYNIPNKLLIGDDINTILTKSMLYLSNCNVNKMQDFQGKNIKSFL